MTDYVIREVSNEADRAAAYRLRYELYVEAQGLFGDTADHERRWLFDDDDAEASLWVAEAEGEIVGTCRLIWGGEGRFDRETREVFGVDALTGVVDEAEIAVASRMLVTPPHRGGPLPVMLTARGWARAIERGVEVILGECEPHLLNRWIRVGFRSYGLCEHPVNGTLARMAYVLGDYEHVAGLKSPLAPVLRKWTKPTNAHPPLVALLKNTQRVVSEAEGRTLFWAAVDDVFPLGELAQRFGGLTDEELEVLLGNGHALDCDSGAMLIRKGHVSRTLFILLTGSLLIRDEGQIVAVVDKPGEVIGEVAFFTAEDRMSDVLIGPKGARVLALSERNLRALIETEGTGTAKFLLALTRSLCHKLRERARRPSDADTLVADMLPAPERAHR
jgi:CRP-like cAMP-binding protein